MEAAIARLLRTRSTASATSAPRRRLGRQRGAKVAQIDLARQLTEAIWYMLTRNQPLPSLRQAPFIVWLPDSPFWTLRHRSEPR